jgi:tRNA pseudouridine38-40 synthase
VQRYALGVEYDGSGFRGWQRLSKPGQPDPDTVQGVLEEALSSVAAAPVSTVCAGRTDAGVHAQCQVVHFDSEAARDPRAWTLGATTRLPPSVSVVWCRPVDAAFNARFSAVARRYRYRILNRQVRPALGRQWLAWVWSPLDADAMHRAAQALVGEHDFEAFRSAECEAAHARRELQHIAVARDGDIVTVDVQANAFLHHMVRNIVGSLLEVGRGARPEDWIAELLAGRDRTRAGPTASPGGLVFLGPRYPRTWPLPEEVLVDAATARRPAKR